MDTGSTKSTDTASTAAAVYEPDFTGNAAAPAAKAAVEAYVFSKDVDDVPNFERQPKARIELLFPPEIAGMKVGHIDMRRPTINDRLINGKLAGSDADRELALFANLTEKSIPELLKLDLVDYGRLQDAFRSFLGFHRPENSDLPS